MTNYSSCTHDISVSNDHFKVNACAATTLTKAQCLSLDDDCKYIVSGKINWDN